MLVLRSQGHHNILHLLVHLADQLGRQLAQQQRGGQAVGQQLIQLAPYLQALDHIQAPQEGILWYHIQCSSLLTYDRQSLATVRIMPHADACTDYIVIQHEMHMVITR